LEAGVPASIPEALTSGVRFARVPRSGIYVALAKRGVRPLNADGYNANMSLKTHIRKKNSQLFLLNDNLRAIAKEIIESNPPINTLKDAIVAFILAKSFKTHGVIMSLSQNGFSEDADMLARTLFDAYLIIASVLKDDSDDTANQYIRFDDEIRTKMYGTLKSKDSFKEYFEERRNNPNHSDESVEEIQSRAEEWKKLYSNNFWNKWHHDKSLGKLATDLDMHHYYETAYQLQTQLSHSFPRVMDKYLIPNKDNYKMQTKPTDKFIDLTLVSTFNIFVFIVMRCDEHFDNKHRSKIEQLIVELREATRSINRD
jgi:hypothetical protein